MTDNRPVDLPMVLLLPERNSLSKDAYSMDNKIGQSPSPTTDQPLVTAKTGETNKASKTSNNPFNRKVEVIADAIPQVAGKTLGDRLSLSGLRLFKMMIIHPKVIFDLATGRLARMRESNPAKYLEELRDLSSSSNHYKFILEEGQQLKREDVNRTTVIEAQQRATMAPLLGSLTENSSAEEIKDVLQVLADYANGIGLSPTMLQTGSKLHTTMGDLCRQIEDQLETDKFHSVSLRQEMVAALGLLAETSAQATTTEDEDNGIEYLFNAEIAKGHLEESLYQTDGLLSDTKYSHLPKVDPT